MNTDWKYNNEHVDTIIDKHGLTVKQIEARTKKYAVQASKGDCFAKFALGFAYKLGLGVSPDQNKSRELLKEASSTSDLELLNTIGEIQYCFEFYGDAVESLGRSYEQGFTGSASTLGVLRLRGLGCEQDTEAAIALFEEAYAHGDREAAVALGQISRERHDSSKSRYWFTKAAEMGDLEMQARYGEFYAMKGETEQEIERGIQWIKNSATHGHRRAIYMLAVLIAFKKIEGTMQQAFEYCQDSATKGEASAQYMLSQLYKNGDGVERNDVLAKRWLKEAKENGSKAAIALGQ